jgi:hypothetical protein
LIAAGFIAHGDISRNHMAPTGLLLHAPAAPALI